MDNKELFQKVRDLNLPMGKYALFGSTPLGVRGIREIRDIDLIVSQDIWIEYLNKEGWSLKSTDKGMKYLESKDGLIEMWNNWLPWYENVSEFIEQADVIDGLPFVKLEYVLDWKKKLGREKDLKDVQLIEEYLKTT